MTTVELTWDDIHTAARHLATRHQHRTYHGVHGIPRGGVPVALITAHNLNLPILDHPHPNALIVDDLADSGTTAHRYPHHTFDALYRKPHTPDTIAPHALPVHGWITFPWETPGNTDITDAVTRLIQYIGENPNREGLTNTPKRVAKAFRELTTGYHDNPETILATTFNVGPIDQMVHVNNIEFVSLCEHHLLPFTGTAHIAYLPNQHVVGLSKIPRTVTAYAKRLQIQERLTEQIADALNTHLQPHGVAVTITAHHSCMGIRGAHQPNATMTTTALRGTFLTNPAAQHEFLTRT